MKFVYDHDLHIHSKLSSCSKDERQTPTRILQYAQDNGLNTVCVTDHLWDDVVESYTDRGDSVFIRLRNGNGPSVDDRLV